MTRPHVKTSLCLLLCMTASACSDQPKRPDPAPAVEYRYPPESFMQACQTELPQCQGDLNWGGLGECAGALHDALVECSKTRPEALRQWYNERHMPSK